MIIELKCKCGRDYVIEPYNGGLRRHCRMCDIDYSSCLDNISWTTIPMPKEICTNFDEDD